MSQATFRCQVHASAETLWNILIDEAERPDSFSDTIKNSKILERFHNGLLRSVQVPDAEVREKIIFDFNAKTITSNLVGHPQLVGIIKKTFREDPTQPGVQILENSLEWESNDNRVEAMLKRNVANFVMDSLDHVKNKAEASSL